MRSTKTTRSEHGSSNLSFGHLAAERYFSGLRADRMMRTVMRVSVHASISDAQMSANSIKYVSSVFMWDRPLAPCCLAREWGLGA
jgi:hypothetical protein